MRIQLLPLHLFKAQGVLCRRLLFTLLALPLIALAQGTYEHAESKLEFPARLGSFERVGVNRYADPRLGVQITYIAQGLGKADIYVFNIGVSPIPDGIDSEPVRLAYSSADRDVHMLVNQGKYLDFKQILPLGSVMRSKGNTEKDWYLALYQFTFNGQGSEPLVSWLFVRGDRGHFIKVRFTHRADQFKEGQTEITRFLEALSDTNSPAEAKADTP